MTTFIDLFTMSELGFAFQLVPIILIIGISYALTKMNVDFLFIQFPITVAIAILIPSTNTAIIVISLGLWILNLMGSMNDALGSPIINIIGTN